MEGIGGVAETRSLRRKGRTDGIMHTRTDEGHFYSPTPPTSGDKNSDFFAIFFNVKVYCSFTLESPHRGDSNEYTQYTNFQYEKERAISVRAIEVLLLFEEECQGI